MDESPSSHHVREMPKRYLYAIDETGAEIPGSRRDISHLDGDWRAIMKAEGELRRVIGEGCEIKDVVE